MCIRDRSNGKDILTLNNYRLLSSIDGPSAIRNLSFDEKEQLAQEVRDYIIAVSYTHLSLSELTRILLFILVHFFSL